MHPRQAGDPDRIASYRVIGRLGAGGMGVVYLAQTDRGTPVAVKTILTGGDPSLPARFQREVEAALRVSSPYTARVIDADTHADPPYLVTEYVAGETLRDYVERAGPLNQHLVEATAIGLAAGLEAIHRVAVAHRDLSAANVMLTADGPRIIDLGVASVEDATRLTQTGTSMGTPAFMAPEHARGEVVGPPSDIFAWGSVIAFAATGMPPFGSGRAEQVLYRIVHEQPALEGLPASLQHHVGRALAKQPAQRPTAGDLLTELTRSVATGTQPGSDSTVGMTALVTDRWQAATAPIRQQPNTDDAQGTAPRATTANATHPRLPHGTASNFPEETEAVETGRPRRRGPIVTAIAAAALTIAAGTYALLPDDETPGEEESAAPDRAAMHSEVDENPEDDASTSSTEEPVGEDDEPQDPDPDPETRPDSEATPAPDPPGRPGPPPAPWDTSPVQPRGHLTEVADRYYNIPEPGWNDCTLYAPTEIESGLEAQPAFWSPVWTRVGSFEFAWEASSGATVTSVAIWPSDSSNVSRYFDQDPQGTTYADGSVVRSGAEFGESLLAIPGQECPPSPTRGHRGPAGADSPMGRGT